MSKNKLQRFRELKTFSNVFQPKKPVFIDWKKHFGNNNPIALELACGKGEYTLGLASMHPERNFIGVDIKGARLWRGAKTALEQKLNNVAFLRTRIELLDNYFTSSPSSSEEGTGVVMKKNKTINPYFKSNHHQITQPLISDIWITFPDPFPKDRHIKHRLTHPHFLKIYKKILKPNGIIHLKTDDLNLFNYSKKIAASEEWKIKKSITDIYAQKNLPPELQIQTFYEKQHLKDGKKIYYIKFTL